MFMNKFEYKKFSVLLLILFSVSSQIKATKRYWISTVTANWNSTSNWSSTSGGGGGSSVPGSNDTCYFDSNGLGRCDIDANVNVKRFEIVSTYTDTITQNAYTITVGTAGMILENGIFLGSSSAITINGHYHNTACYFKSTSGTLEVKGDFELTGTSSFYHNSGTVKLSYSSSFANSNISSSTSSVPKQLNALILDAAAQKGLTVTSGDTLHVGGMCTT